MVFRNKWENIPILRDFEFRMIGNEDNEVLASEFLEEEIRSAVWDRDSRKVSVLMV